jgi:hypothetical protein
MAIDNDGYNGDEEDEEEMALNTSKSYETSKIVPRRPTTRVPNSYPLSKVFNHA